MTVLLPSLLLHPFFSDPCSHSPCLDGVNRTPSPAPQHDLCLPINFPFLKDHCVAGTRGGDAGAQQAAPDTQEFTVSSKQT